VTPGGRVILVTGGAGFIGSHLVDRLVDAGRSVRVLDLLDPQVHADGKGHRNPKAEYVEGSVADRVAVESALASVGAVVHLAAQVGVGQSAYEIDRYVHDNALGTAVLLQALTERADQVSTLVVASSMSIYGEGRYACDGCDSQDASVTRTVKALGARRWEPVCRHCGAEPRPVPTPETKRLEPDSVYAITKRDQEELCLSFGRAYGVRTVALRLFNVYGPRQSLSNPYTGVAAIFCSRLLNGQAPLVFEDGLQTRDFVHVNDVTSAFELALDRADVDGVAVNVGTGQPISIMDVARVLIDEIGCAREAEVMGRYRRGDVRHCFPDVTLARDLLGYMPTVTFAEGMRTLVSWIQTTVPQARDSTERARQELEARNLVV
jgi:dTDP-L-rhamnose 4-epimerase